MHGPVSATICGFKNEFYCFFAKKYMDENQGVNGDVDFGDHVYKQLWYAKVAGPSDSDLARFENKCIQFHHSLGIISRLVPAQNENWMLL